MKGDDESPKYKSMCNSLKWQMKQWERALSMECLVGLSYFIFLFFSLVAQLCFDEQRES